MFFNYGYKVGKILNIAEKERYNLAHPYVGSEHLLLSILKADEECIKIFNNYNVNYSIFRETLVEIVGSASKKQEINLYTPLLKRIIANATDIALEEKREVTCKDLIMSLLEEAEGIAYRLLISLDVDLDKLYKDLKKTNNTNNMAVLEVGTNLNKTVNMDEKVIGREDIINEIIEVLLRKKKNNPLLVGKAGVGKTAIVEELARRINKKEVPLFLKDKQIISIETASLVAGTKYRGEFEERLTKIINEIKDNPNIILFIDEIHSIAHAGGSEGAINAADILKPSMARGNIKIIGATTIEEYERSIVKDQALERRFEKIVVEEPSLKETLNLMINIKDEYEDYHDVSISNEVIEYLVSASDEFISNKNNPDKCIELLDSVCSHVKLCNTSNNKEDLIKLKNEYLNKGDYKKASYYLKEFLSIGKKKIPVTKEDVLNVIKSRINLPSKDNINLLKKNIDDKELLKIIEDKYNNLNSLKSVLLIESNNILESLIKYYNTKSSALIIDLREYDNLNKLIGVSAGYVGYEDNYALKDIINYPYSLVVFKNIDKAKREVKNIVDKIIKEGVITNGKGEILDFKKSFIVCTKKESKKCKVGFENDYISSNEFIKVLA